MGTGDSIAIQRVVEIIQSPNATKAGISCDVILHLEPGTDYIPSRRPFYIDASAYRRLMIKRFECADNYFFFLLSYLTEPSLPPLNKKDTELVGETRVDPW